MIQTAYNQIVTFLYQWHSRDQFLDKNCSIALYAPPDSLYLFVNWERFAASINNHGQRVWKASGYKYEK